MLVVLGGPRRRFADSDPAAAGHGCSGTSENGEKL
jgi:hypothetical protein